MMITIMVTGMFTGYQRKDSQSMIQHILTTTVMDIGDMMNGMVLDTVTDMIVIILPTLMRKMKSSISSTVSTIYTMEVIMVTTTEIIMETTMEINILRIITIFIIMAITTSGSITRMSTHTISSITDLLQNTLRVSTILITITME